LGRISYSLGALHSSSLLLLFMYMCCVCSSYPKSHMGIILKPLSCRYFISAANRLTFVLEGFMLSSISNYDSRSIASISSSFSCYWQHMCVLELQSPAVPWILSIILLFCHAVKPSAQWFWVINDFDCYLVIFKQMFMMLTSRNLPKT
jgi:hypothetical protein